ncbi:MAG: hypothetical protein QMC93_01620 [Patescibacteria group bacterium]|nr:hypothetical protein [Patescibacteria group bacterium]
MRFFRKKKKEEFLVLDFGSSSVKGLIFEKGERENIIKNFALSDLERFGVFDGRDFENDLIKKSAEKVIKKLGLEERISQIQTLVGLSPKIIKGRIVNLSFKRKNPEGKINKEEVQQIYSLIFQEGERKLCQEFLTKSGIVPRDLKILKKKVFGKKISGYPVESLFGFQGENLDFKLLFIFGLRDFLKNFLNIFSSLKIKKFEIFQEVEGLIALTKRKETEGIFLDIGKEFTQIFSVKEESSDSLLAQSMVEWMEEFKGGGDIFTDVLCQDLGLTEKEGEELKSRLSRDRLSQESREKIESFFSEAKENWQEKLKEKLKDNVKTQGAFSNKFYLFGGGSLLPLIKRIIAQENFGDLPFPKEIKVKYLTLEDLPLEIKVKISSSARIIPSVLLSYAQKNS